MSVSIPVSWGELFDRLGILEIKAARIQEPAKAANIQRELAALGPLGEGALARRPEVEAWARELKGVNEALWEIEDAIRCCEGRGDFGPRFVELARSVYRENDRRFRLKRQINELLDSGLVEEKSYPAY